MMSFPTLLLCVSPWLTQMEDARLQITQTARWREVLYDGNNVREQSQAAFQLVSERSATAEDIVRRGLRQTSSPEVYLALVSALRLAGDRRFNEELFEALSTSGASGRAPIRQSTAEALATLIDTRTIDRLRVLLQDQQSELSLRQTSLWTLGRSGRKAATAVLIDQLSSEHEGIQRAAADSLSALTGLTYGTDRSRWQAWWEQHKNLTNEEWLDQRLAYQSSRARRLEGELEKTRGQMLALHQQLYARLPLVDRVAQVQVIAESDDPAVRQFAINCAVELLGLPPSGQPAAGRESMTAHSLTDMLLRLSHDSHAEVQRLAVLGLGRTSDDPAFTRLCDLLREGRAPIRAAAARALAQQARSMETGLPARRKQIVPLLQKALEDPALEVVVEAAEDLGALGVPEAGPVLVCLLRHSSEHVRQTAAQALERTADDTVLESLLASLDDSVVTVRFALVGAISRAIGSDPSQETREQVAERLRTVLQKDADPGVRSRAATVLGAMAPPSALPSLWQRISAVEDGRVQEKAWAAFLDVLQRAASVDLVREWNAVLTNEKQGTRRTQLLSDLYDRWHKRTETRPLSVQVAPMLATAHLDEGKWQPAEALLREGLANHTASADRERTLRLMLRLVEQALREGNHVAAGRVLSEVRVHVSSHPTLADDFRKLQQQVQKP